jgi:oligoendopeptidase F
MPSNENMEETMTAAANGVTWDLSRFFPAFDGPEMRQFKKALADDIASLRQKAGALGPLEEETASAWEAIVLAGEDLESRLAHLSAYLGCLTAAHAEEEAYARERAAAAALQAEFDKCDVALLRAFKPAGNATFEAFIARGKLKPIAHALRRVRQRAGFSMSSAEEILAADLNLDGLDAWGRLYDQVTGKLAFDLVDKNGKTERRPISQWRTLMSDPDREIGRAAFAGGNRAWAGIADMCAAALNAIAGTRLTLNRHRGVAHFLDRAIFQAGIQRETLEAMYAAIHDRIETARAILRAKAEFMGRTGIWFFEREAPLPLANTGRHTWRQATAKVATAFASGYPDLAVYFRAMLDNRWIEAEQRPGKRPGAFCSDSPLTGEQRVFMTFSGALGNITTLAHEVGHAWHSHLLRDLRPLAQHYPMTLAETASIFAESLLAEGIYRDPDTPQTQKLLMLDDALAGAAVLLLDITTRFEFEKAFYTERGAGEVPVSRLKTLMCDSQRRIYGDTLLADGADPYFCASKLHFYITGVTFYNFPYTFGFLLARALTTRFRTEGREFLPRYETFLKMTGSDTVENVTRAALGVDLTAPAFWETAIDSLQAPLARYRRLLAATRAADHGPSHRDKGALQ